MPGGGRALAQELAALGLELGTLLGREPRLLWNAEFLSSLHEDLLERLGPDRAEATLLQLGFLHGLHDALTVLRAGFAPLEPPGEGRLAAPRLALQLSPVKDGPVWRGSWPEAIEVRALGAHEGGREAPACFASAGYTAGWLSGILDADLIALEECCRARGDAECSFVARDANDWYARGTPRAQTALAALDFAQLRRLAAEHLPAAEAPEAGERYEPGSAVIHVWGPVMVLPFAGSDECLRSLELLGRDPGARAVKVVVVDLSGAVIDEGFGAASLEQVLDAVEGWGAEPLLTGISPFSERVVADLERTHLVIRKDLPDAIASAFQIAEAQRRGA
jgi:hypothetical protein